MPSNSRGSLFAALRPNNWVGLFELIEYYGDAFYTCNEVRFSLEADVANAANVIVAIEECDDDGDGNPDGNWILRYQHPTQIVPGGEETINYYHVRVHVRALVYSTGSGQVLGTWMPREAQALPNFQDSISAALVCSTFCEVSCETGDETTGEYA